LSIKRREECNLLDGQVQKEMVYMDGAKEASLHAETVQEMIIAMQDGYKNEKLGLSPGKR